MRPVMVRLVLSWELVQQALVPGLMPQVVYCHRQMELRRWWRLGRWNSELGRQERALEQMLLAGCH